MRNRIVAVLVAIVVGVVLLYGIPRAYFLADLVHNQETRETQQSADLIAVAVAERQAAAGEVTPDFLEQLLHDHESLVVIAGGTTLRVGQPATDDDPGDVVATRSLPDGGEVTLRRSGDLVGERVAEAILPLVLLGLGVALAAAVVVRLVAHRLSRPFLELAEVADAIGRGHFEVDIPHYRVGEAEAIGGAMRRGIARLGELRRREHDIATNASHELRSPISALRMEIEDLASWPETPPQVAQELTSYLPQLDRLNAAVRTYLDAAEQQRLLDVDVVDLTDAVRQAFDRWRPRLRRTSGPALVLVDEPGTPLHVCASDQSVAEILDHLLQDAVDRRPTHILVEIDATEGYGRVRLELESERAPGRTEAKQAATVIAIAVGGRLTTVDGHTLVMLRRVGDTASGGTDMPRADDEAAPADD
jgi:signal transduction histidine kinase